MGNSSNRQEYQDYPRKMAEAKERFALYGAKDCFPQIAPALLNSADIKAYVKNTGMIFPFHEEDLQSASYKVRIAGQVRYWVYDDSKPKRNDGKKQLRKETITLKPGDSFELQPNSIAFVTLEPVFHIPQYLALRFNLKITHIYKGLLLGTGPLVDPGFQGRLSIPLHNLTNNTYRFKYGDTLITMEFTKLSPYYKWYQEPFARTHEEECVFEPIPAGRNVDAYIANALEKDHLSSIISSIPDSIYDSKIQAKEARIQAEEARAGVDKVKQHSAIITIGSIIGVFGIVITSITFAFNAINKANDRYDTIKKEIEAKYSTEISSLQNENKNLNDIIKELKVRIEELEKQNEGQGTQDSEVN